MIQHKKIPWNEARLQFRQSLRFVCEKRSLVMYSAGRQKKFNEETAREIFSLMVIYI